MGIQIEDGRGTGSRCMIDSDNRIRAYSVVEPELAYAADEKGDAYAWTSVTYDYGAGDTILLLKNTSTSKKLIIDSIIMTTDTATIAHIHMPTCGTPTGTALTGVNLNSSSNNVAEATAKADETTNAIGVAGIVATLALEADKTNTFQAKSSLVLGTNKCVAVDYVTDGTAATVTITGYFHI